MRDPATPTPGVFVSADSKELAGEMCVSADSKELKVAVFSVGQLGTAHSKGVRRTAWRASMDRRAQRNRADSTQPL